MIFIKIIFLSLFLAVASFASEKKKDKKKALPLFEAGLGTVIINIPDYPAASHSSTHTIPFPVVIYRGDILRADREGGIRSRFFKSERLELNISFGLAPKARSKNNPERNGMPDLDTILEIGPNLIYHFLKSSKNKDMLLDLSIPIRSAISTDLKSVDGRGFVFNPFLYFRKQNIFIQDLGLFLGADFRFATQKNMATFYTVESQFVTASRDQFRAKGGYLGSSLLLGLNYLISKKIISFVGFQHSNYHLARNQKSPLFAKKNNTSIAFGLIWFFFQSKRPGSHL